MKRNHIILISGLFSSVVSRYSKWAESLETRFQKHYGFQSDTVIHRVSSDGAGEKPAITAVLKDHASGTLGSVAIVGHSNGAGELEIASKTFYQKGIKVVYAATIDRTLGYLGNYLYGSVGYFDEFWAKLRKTEFHPTFTGSKHFYNLNVVNKKPVGHVQAASLPFVQDKIFKEVTTRIK